MDFSPPLTPARLIRRYKRFLADVETEHGELLTVHCANPGAMTGLAVPGMRVFLSKSSRKTRKLPWSWEIVEADGTLVGINTAYPNRLVSDAITAEEISQLAGYKELRREVGYGENSRVDILLSGPNWPDAYVEVKNVHLLRQVGLAEFPDSVTKRGAKHLLELTKMVEAGRRAVMFYLIQRNDADRFALARDIDPTYGAAFDSARSAGVEMLAYRCTISPNAITVADQVDVTEA